MRKDFLSRSYKLHLRKYFMLFAIFLLVASNMSATVFPTQAHAEENTGAIQAAAAENACPAPVALINGSFEQPKARNVGDKGSTGTDPYWMYFFEDEVPGWKTTATDKRIQIMKTDNNYSYEGTGIKIIPPDGDQYGIECAGSFNIVSRC